MILSVLKKDSLIYYELSKREDISDININFLNKLTSKCNISYFYKERVSDNAIKDLFFSEETVISYDIVNLIVKKEVKTNIKDKSSSNFFSLKNLPKFLRSFYKE